MQGFIEVLGLENRYMPHMQLQFTSFYCHTALQQNFRAPPLLICLNHISTSICAAVLRQSCSWAMVERTSRFGRRFLSARTCTAQKHKHHISSHKEAQYRQEEKIFICSYGKKGRLPKWKVLQNEEPASFVKGEVSWRASHCSMADRSYVLPSLAITGSCSYQKIGEQSCLNANNEEHFVQKLWG